MTSLILKHKLLIALMLVVHCTMQPERTLAFTKDQQQSVDSEHKPSKKIQKRKKQSSLFPPTPTNDFFKKSQQEDLLRSTTQLGILIGLTGATYALLGEPFVLSALIAPTIGNICTEPIMNIGSKFSLLFMPKIAKASLQKVVKLQSIYQKKARYLSDSMNDFMQMTLNRYMFLIDKFSYIDHMSERAIEEILSLPIFPKKLDLTAIPSVNAFLMNYPEQVRVAVANFVVQLLQDSHKMRLSRKAEPLMIVGPPGTGKTYLAKQLGKLLGVPTHVIDLSKYSNLAGSHFSQGSVDKGVVLDILLDNQDMQHNCTNKIIIIDEVDKFFEKDGTGAFTNANMGQIMAYLLFLLESQATAVNLPRYEGASHDISQLKFILLGNHTLSEMLGEEQAQPLESRMHVVTLDHLTQEQKLNIAKEHIAQICKIGDLETSMIDQTTIEEIVKEDTAAGYKGVRIMLQVIDKYIRMLEQGDLIKRISSITELTFDPKKEYASRAPKQMPTKEPKKTARKKK